MSFTLNWAGDDFLLLVTKATHRGLHDVGVAIHRDALVRTPLDEGSLRESSQVLINGNTMTVGGADGVVDVIASSNPLTPDTVTELVIGYNTPYALRQHEELDYFHPVGEAKFLEKAAIATDIEGIFKQTFFDVVNNG